MTWTTFDSRSDADPGEMIQREQEQRKPARYNPRLVFADPDTFFDDLLMEQNEQQ